MDDLHREQRTRGTGRILAAAALALLAAGLVGCDTTGKAIVAPAEPTQKLERDGITLTLRYLDEKSLKTDFGTGANPFLTSYHRLSFRRFLVFEVTLHNQSAVPVELTLNRCTLDYGAKQTEPTNRFQLTNYWGSLDDDQRIVAQKKKLIDRYVLPNVATVPVGSTRFGYLVFMGNLPREGEAVVRVPVFREGGSVSFDARYTF
jgi:hypothetical protein